MQQITKTWIVTLLLGATLVACPPSKQDPKTGAGSAKGTAASSGSGHGSPGTASGSKSGSGRVLDPHHPKPAAKAAGGVKTPKKAFAQLSAETARASFFDLASRRLRKIASTFPTPEQRPVAAPLSLTASDGTGLELISMTAKAVLEGPLAFTELHLVFRNPLPRTIEGRFSITLPPKAAISRLAMKLPQGWMEAEVVERQRARQIYEDFLHRRQDPALLEKKAGNEFSARIFPIAGNAEKEIKISFSQQLLSAKTPYRLPLLGLPKMRVLTIRAFLSRAQKSAAATSMGGTILSQQVVKVNKRDYKPDRDFIVAAPAGAPRGLRKGHLAVVRIAPKLSVMAAPVKSLLVLVDTSASRAAGFASQVERLGGLLRALRDTQGAAVPLKLVGFDQTIGTIYEGSLGGLEQKHLRALLARRALGASDIHGALRWAAGVSGFERMLLVTDAVATAGQTGGGALREAVKKLKGHVSRLDMLLVGGIRDEELAVKLVRGNLAADGVVLDGAQDAARLAARLAKATVSGVEVSVPGSKWVWPSRLDGLQPGDEVLVYADLASMKPASKAPIVVKLSGALTGSYEVPWASVKGPLLQRAWVRARIAKLGAQRDALSRGDRDLREAIDKQIVTISTTNRVLCDKTALLVLQSEYDYQRYGIKRTALADILAVGAGGVEVINRKQPVYVQTIRRPRIARRATQNRRRRPQDRDRLGDGAMDRPTNTKGAALSTGGLAQPLSDSSLRGKGGAAGGKAKASAAAPVMASVEPRPPANKMKRRARPGASRHRVHSLRASRPHVISERNVPARRRRDARVARRRRPMSRQRRASVSPWTGRFATVMKSLKGGRVDTALEAAMVWRREKPGDVLALVALGEALAKAGELQLAARAYGSIIDLFPSRADLRRFAGERLETLGKIGLPLAADSYAEAVAERPDHPNSHRMLAWCLVRLGRYEDAFVAISKGLRRRYPGGRFRGVRQIMQEDQGLIAAAWLAAEPKNRDEIEKMLSVAGARPDKRPSLRFILSWETDSNDVDFHIRDRRGGHAYFSHKELPSGGRLYADVTTGYGPECFAIFGKPKAFPYRLQIHYYSRGPMGYGMGRIQIIQHDGKGHLRFAFRSYVVMRDRAYVDLGKVSRPL